MKTNYELKPAAIFIYDTHDSQHSNLFKKLEIEYQLSFRRELSYMLNLIFKYASDINRYTKAIPKFKESEENTNSEGIFALNDPIDEGIKIRRTFRKIFNSYFNSLQDLFNNISSNHEEAYEEITRILPATTSDIAKSILIEFSYMHFKSSMFGYCTIYKGYERNIRLNSDLQEILNHCDAIFINRSLLVAIMQKEKE